MTTPDELPNYGESIEASIRQATDELGTPEGAKTFLNTFAEEWKTSSCPDCWDKTPVAPCATCNATGEVPIPTVDEVLRVIRAFYGFYKQRVEADVKATDGRTLHMNAWWSQDPGTRDDPPTDDGDITWEVLP